jgi:hypothetical protein
MERVTDEQLLERYIATFEKLDEMVVDVISQPAAMQLVLGVVDEDHFQVWKPLKVETPSSQLEEIYARMLGKFPGLFEQMVLSYRWAEVDLGTYRLFANPPGDDLMGLFRQMSKDSGLWESLIPAGFVPFGKGPDLDYDPVCFDMKSRKQGGDYRIVKIDHEQILCNHRVKIVSELAPSFYELILQTIVRAESASPAMGS